MYNETLVLILCPVHVDYLKIQGGLFEGSEGILIFYVAEGQTRELKC